MQNWAPNIDVLEEQINKLVAKVMIWEFVMRVYGWNRGWCSAGVFWEIESWRLHCRIWLVKDVFRNRLHARQTCTGYAVGRHSLREAVRV